MNPEEALLFVTEPGSKDEKCCAKNPSVSVATCSAFGFCKASGLFATDFSNTANIFFFFLLLSFFFPINGRFWGLERV